MSHDKEAEKNLARIKLPPVAEAPAQREFDVPAGRTRKSIPRDAKNIIDPRARARFLGGEELRWSQARQDQEDRDLRIQVRDNKRTSRAKKAARKKAAQKRLAPKTGEPHVRKLPHSSEEQDLTEGEESESPLSAGELEQEEAEKEGSSTESESIEEEEEEEAASAAPQKKKPRRKPAPKSPPKRRGSKKRTAPSSEEEDEEDDRSETAASTKQAAKKPRTLGPAPVIPRRKWDLAEQDRVQSAEYRAASRDKEFLAKVDGRIKSLVALRGGVALPAKYEEGLRQWYMDILVTKKHNLENSLTDRYVADLFHRGSYTADQNVVLSLPDDKGQQPAGVFAPGSKHWVKSSLK